MIVIKKGFESLFVSIGHLQEEVAEKKRAAFADQKSRAFDSHVTRLLRPHDRRSASGAPAALARRESR